MLIRKIFHIAVGLIALISFSCDAPRNNPLDPMNPSGLGVIEGNVKTLSVPFQAIEGALVYFDQGSAMGITDINGLFRIEKVPLVDGSLIFVKEGYLTDTVKIKWSGLKKITVGVNLNNIPVIDSLTFYTVVINQYNANPTYELVIKARINDNDNDIDSVYMINETYGLMKRLDFNELERVYLTTINSQELLAANIVDIEQLIGEEFKIIVKDAFGRYFNTGTSKVSRVIKSEVETLTPAGGDSTGVYPTFKWRAFKAGYPFTYKLEIFTNDLGNSQLVYQKEAISADLIEFTSPVLLEKKEYYWVIWVIDNFQNRSRSKPKTFEVK